MRRKPPLALCIVFWLFICSQTFAGAFTVENVSKLPIHSVEHSNSKANMIAIIGGKGLKNKKGKSKNYLVKHRDIFTNSELNYYLFPNSSMAETASYPLRASKKRADRILALVKAITERNSLPTFLVGFSRGSVDVGSFAKRYPKTIQGIVLASGVYKNNSKKAREYSMEKIIGAEINTAVLIVHHKKDKCKVTRFNYAHDFAKSLHSPKKHFLFYDEGEASGRSCGPLHYHGFEAIEEKVANDIAEWIISDANSKK